MSSFVQIVRDLDRFVAVERRVERLIDDGLAGRLEPASAEFERFVDVTARKPSGEAGAAHYRDPKEHQASFQTALDLLDLSADDRYLELGFGGGQLLELALQRVRAAAGIDHSVDMLALASERNVRDIVAGRLQLVYGDVHDLPWRDGEFSRAACVNAFFFVERPLDCLQEVRRVLRPGGVFVIVTVAEGDVEESNPWGPALRTYSRERFSAMLRDAGFADISIREESRKQLVRAVAS
jgi:SAM-dependent methyltransferase